MRISPLFQPSGYTVVPKAQGPSKTCYCRLAVTKGGFRSRKSGASLMFALASFLGPLESIEYPQGTKRVHTLLWWHTFLLAVQPRYLKMAIPVVIQKVA